MLILACLLLVAAAGSSVPNTFPLGDLPTVINDDEGGREREETTNNPFGRQPTTPWSSIHTAATAGVAHGFPTTIDVPATQVTVVPPPSMHSMPPPSMPPPSIGGVNIADGETFVVTDTQPIAETTEPPPPHPTLHAMANQVYVADLALEYMAGGRRQGGGQQDLAAAFVASSLTTAILGEWLRPELLGLPEAQYQDIDSHVMQTGELAPAFAAILTSTDSPAQEDTIGLMMHDCLSSCRRLAQHLTRIGPSRRERSRSPRRWASGSISRPP